MSADHKFLFPSSPIRVHRSSTLLRSNQIGSTRKSERSEIQPTNETISSEFQELAKMIKKSQNGEPNSSNFTRSRSKSKSSFERGKFYDEYSARRNERLKRKKSSVEEGGDEENKMISDLGFVSELPVKKKKKKNVKKSDEFNSSILIPEINESVNPIPRYSLRSRTKDNNLPPLPSSSVGGGGGRKPAGSRARKS